MEVLKRSHFSLQMGNCPIPVAEDSGHCSLLFDNSSILNLHLKIVHKKKNETKDTTPEQDITKSLKHKNESSNTITLKNHAVATHKRNRSLSKTFECEMHILPQFTKKEAQWMSVL